MIARTVVLVVALLCPIVADASSNADTPASPIVPITTLTIPGLAADVASTPAPAGIRNSLSAKLDAAEAAYQRGNVTAATNMLRAFINETQAQRGKSVPTASASRLMAMAGDIIAALRSGLKLGGVTVDAAGAVLKVADPTSPAYGAELIIPPHALSTSVPVSMTVPEGKPIVEGIAFPGSGIRLEPSGLTFASPATLILPYPDIDGDGLVDGTDITVNALKVGVEDGTGDIAFLPSTVDIAAKTQTTQIAHFSLYWNVVWRWRVLQTLTYRIDDEALRTAVGRAAAVWSPVLAQAGITLRDVADGQSALVRFGFTAASAPLPIDGTTYPQDVIPGIRGGAVFISIDHDLTDAVLDVSLDPSLSDGTLEAAAVHALGHVMGLNDLTVSAAAPPVMAPRADRLAPETCLFTEDVESFRSVYALSSAMPFPRCPDAGMSVTPSTFNFGLTPLNASIANRFTIVSTGTGTLMLSTASLNGAPAFSLDATAVPRFLKPGDTAAFTATFMPTATGLQQATVTIDGNAADAPTLVGLSGTGKPLQPPPSITSLNPTAGSVGQVVTIIGTNFGATQATSTVTFNGTLAPILSWSATSISVTVPVRATTGPVIVTTDGQVSNGVMFTAAPVIASLDPTSVIRGQTLTIRGLNFGSAQGTSAVTFNGAVMTVVAWSDTSVAAIVPAGVNTGKLIVTANGVVSNAVTVIVMPPPTLSSLKPPSGAAGQLINISGANFGDIQGSSTVSFNEIVAAVTAWSATAIHAIVPPSVTTGPVVVSVNRQRSNGVVFTSNANTSPLTISAQATPAPNAAGWYGSNVTVTFTCTDSDYPVTVCPPATSVQQDGAELLVAGEAVDSAGNRASITLALNVDRVSPGLTIYSPRADGVLPSGTTTAVVKGSAYDFRSGVESVRCNGEYATVTDRAYVCPAPVAEGSNTVHVEVRDRAGHVTAKDITVKVGDVPPTSIKITPASMTIVAGETRSLAVTDERGRSVVAGSWTVSNAVVAQVVVDNGAASVRGLAGGTATATVTLNSLTAQANVTVLAAGTTLSGTIWSVDGSSGTAPVRAEVVRAVGVEASDGSTPAALFYVEYGLQENVSTTRIRATAADGRQLWTSSTLNPIKQVAADHYGGILLDVGTRSQVHAIGTGYSIRRLDGLTGNVLWEYIPQGDSPFLDQVRLTELALHPDGRLFVTEERWTSTDLIALDSQTGATSARWRFGPVLSPFFTSTSASTPLIREDGSVAVVQYQADTLGNRRLMLFELADGSNALTATEINSGAVNLFVLQARTLDRAIPDGRGGLLISAAQIGAVFHLGTDGALSQPLVVGLGNFDNVVEYVLGDTSAYALVQHWPGSFFSGARLIEFDPVTLAIRTQTSLPGGPNLHLQAALAGFGVEYSGPAFGNAAQVGPGLYASWLPGPILQIGSEALEATTPWTYVRGNPQGANAGPVPYTDFESAALAALEYIYPFTKLMNWEWGGLICSQDNGYFWSRLTTDRNQSSVNFAGVSCAPNGVAIARYHTHPPIEKTDPSGGDITNANSAPELTFYLKAPKPDGTWPPSATHVFRYRGLFASPCVSNECVADERSAQRHTFERVNGTWIPYVW